MCAYDEFIRPFTAISNGLASVVKLLTKMMSKKDSHRFNIALDILAFLLLGVILFVDYGFEMQGVAKFIVSIFTLCVFVWCARTQLSRKLLLAEHKD